MDKLDPAGHWWRLVGVLLAGVMLVAGCSRQPPELAGLPAKLDYNWHVRPILSENCFRCHGLDVSSREAGLRLDDPDVALAELKESPGLYAIVPGDPESSELIRRVTHPDPEERMPPPEVHKVLTETQVAILQEWIEQGARVQASLGVHRPAASSAPTNEPRRQGHERDRRVRLQPPQARRPRAAPRAGGCGIVSSNTAPPSG